GVLDLGMRRQIALQVAECDHAATLLLQPRHVLTKILRRNAGKGMWIRNTVELEDNDLARRCLVHDLAKLLQLPAGTGQAGGGNQKPMMTKRIECGADCVLPERNLWLYATTGQTVAQIGQLPHRLRSE